MSGGRRQDRRARTAAFSWSLICCLVCPCGDQPRISRAHLVGARRLGDVQRHVARVAHDLVLDVGERRARLARRARSAGASASSSTASSASRRVMPRPPSAAVDRARQERARRSGRATSRRRCRCGRARTSRAACSCRTRREVAACRRAGLGYVSLVLAHELARRVRRRPCRSRRGPCRRRGAQALLRLLEQRRLGLARPAPRGPEVQYDDLAAQRGERPAARGAQLRAATRRRPAPAAACPRAPRSPTRCRPCGPPRHRPRAPPGRLPTRRRQSGRQSASRSAKGSARAMLRAAAAVAQLVEHQLPKLRVASSNLVRRSHRKPR